jgi:signal transduction histidine kinase
VSNIKQPRSTVVTQLAIQWKKWITPRATDPDDAFRERTIRGMVPILAFVVVGSGIVLSNLEEGRVLFIVLGMGVILVAAAVAISRHHLNLAAVLLFLFPVFASAASLLSSGYWSFAGIVTAYVSVVFGAIILPRRVMPFLLIGMIVGYALVAFVVDARGLKSPYPPDNTFGTPIGAIAEVTILSSLFFGIGYYLLTELEHRRKALSSLVESLEDRVAERTRDLQSAHQETERLYAEQVQLTEQLRELDNVKSRFLASMSHELRTPLNAVLNFSKFVATGMLGPVNDRQADALNKSINSGKHLLALINDVLDISKIESGMLTLFIEADIDLKAEIQAIGATAETLLAEKPDVHLIRVLPDTMPLIVGDRRRIHQILLNLVSNACKFTKQGSVTIGAETKGKLILLSVKDTGPGIAQTDQEIIFEPFRQTAHGLSQGGGTGLGLAIAKRLAEAHGGKLWVDSAPGAGASFFVQLPLQSEVLKAQIATPEED